MKSVTEIKYLFIASGPGEAGQARALAKFISQKGGKVLFALRQNVNLSFVASDRDFKVFVSETPLDLKEIMEKEKPDALLLFHSKIGGFKGFLENPPFEKPSLTVCVDSNWLFNEKLYPAYNFIKWADKYLVLFPGKIFNLGLKKNGGDFTISPDILEKIIPIGFIPSYVKPSPEAIGVIRKGYNIKENEKFVFSYFSGLGASHRIFALYNMISAVDRLIKKGRKIKVLYVGPTEDLDAKRINKNWLAIKTELAGDEYFQTLSSSDLVFQHQGMVTLSQSISSQVPAIANVHLLKGKPIPKLHFWELNPFKKAGVCEVCSKTTPVKIIAEKIEKLLYDNRAIEKMKARQKMIFENGEEKAFELINKLMR